MAGTSISTCLCLKLIFICEFFICKVNHGRRTAGPGDENNYRQQGQSQLHKVKIPTPSSSHKSKRMPEGRERGISCNSVILFYLVYNS